MLVNAVQGTDAWHLARLGKATASRFTDIIGRTKSGYKASRKNYLAELVVERITGQRKENFTSSAMQNGIDYEPVARLAYELETGNEVEETGFWVLDNIEAGASPDGLVNHDGILEIKNPLPATHLETLKNQKVPLIYYAQVQGQMWATGRKWCDFVSYCAQLPDNAQMIIIRVDRDESFIKELELEVEKFLSEVDEQVKFVTNYKG